MEKQILKYIFKHTSLRQFNSAIENYNLQSLYDRHQNYLIRNFFDDNRLLFSIKMSKIFNKFQTTNDEQKARAISNEIYFMKSEVLRKKKYKLPHKELVIKYNSLVDKLNTLNKPVKKLISLYKNSR